MLAAVAVVHALTPLALLGAHWGLGIDESIYLSQIDRPRPRLVCSQHPERAVPPSWLPRSPPSTDSTAALRAWLSVLSSYRVVHRLPAVASGVPAVPVVAIAALLFSSIWSVAYYGFEAMPNEWVAFAVLAAAGHLTVFCCATRVGGTSLAPRSPWRGLHFYARPMRASLLWVSPRPAFSSERRDGSGCGEVWGAAAAGVGLGTAEWVVEAYTRFGGLDTRVHAAQAEQGGGRLSLLRSRPGPIAGRTTVVSSGL